MTFFTTSKKKIIGFSLLVALIILAFMATVCYQLISKDTALESQGPTQVTDHRDLPVVRVNTTRIADGLDAPWGMDWLPNGDLLITERFGSLLLLHPQTGQRSMVNGVPEVFSAGQGGLLDVTVHPEFQDNRFIYLSYSAGSEEGNRLTIARARLNGTNLENTETIFEAAQNKAGAGHFGSRFTWLPDGTLLFSVGDGGNPPASYRGQLIREQAQSLQAHFGKIIRIEDDGRIPADNPFNGRPDVRREIWSYGHRNVQGITFDAKGGRVFATEHGSKGGDELNLVTAGTNYGWPLTTYSTEYDISGTPISEYQELPGMQDPIAVWTPSIAPSGIVYYDADRYQNWKDSLFLAAMVLRADRSLMAYATLPAGAILRIELDPSGLPRFQQRIDLGPYRIRDIDQGQDGFLYVLTDGTDPQNKPGTRAGALLRIDSVQ
ncbi:MAG: PQQ-dependent sugar dehydrogenase [Verrucomicrobiota bacterium]